MKKEDVNAKTARYLIKNYEPTIDCVESKGVCDYRDAYEEDECPCQKIIRLKKKLESE